MNPNIVEKILEYVKGSPETMDYGMWGALNPQQRDLIKKLCNSWLVLNDATNMQTKEIERLKKELEIEQDISDGMLETIDKAIEYIEDKWEMVLKDSIKDFLDHDETIERKRIEHILEILKKEENNESRSMERY